MRLKTKTLNFAGQVFCVGIDVHKKNWKVKVRSNHSVIKSLSIDPSPEVLSTTLMRIPFYLAPPSGFIRHLIPERSDACF